MAKVNDVWLFRMVGYLEPAKDDAETYSNPEDEALIERIMQLPDADRAELGGIVDLKLKRLGRG